MLSFELIALTFIVVSISSFDNVTFPLADVISLLLYKGGLIYGRNEKIS